MKRSKRGRHEERIHDDSEGSWAVSYGDMVTLLLTFFIVFFSLDPQQEKIEKRKNLNMALVKELQRAPASELANEFKGKKGQIKNDVKTALLGKVHEYGDTLMVEFPDVSFFHSGEINLTSDGSKSLTLFIDKYMPYVGQYTISIQAFTDQRKVKNKNGRKFSDNLELSALRSIAAMRFLQKKGIPLSQMEVAGFGELRSTAIHLMELNKSKQILELSRKIVLVIKPEET